ncbi:MAG: hypothetical protein AB8G95_14135 [Anaerolineae bacterium]
MSTPKAHPRPTIDVNKNGIQTRFDFKELKDADTPTKKAIKAIAKKRKSESLQLRLIHKKQQPDPAN